MYLAIKKFARFQHYRDRNPPWIKLYGDLLTDLRFLQMPEAAQGQLVKLWILASQFGHPLPNDPKLLAGKIGTKGRFYLAEMIAGGFLIECATIDEANLLAREDENASKPASGPLAKPLAKSSENATPSVRARIQSSELEEIKKTDCPSDSIDAPELATISAVSLAVWSNAAIVDRWGEQPNPLTPASAEDLLAGLRSMDPDWRVVKASIYRQCRESKKAHPPRAVNYFARGIQDDMGREEVRRLSPKNGAPSHQNPGQNGHRSRSKAAATMTVGDRSYAESTAAFDAAFGQEDAGNPSDDNDLGDV